jgi:hypothetical protein
MNSWCRKSGFAGLLSLSLAGCSAAPSTVAPPVAPSEAVVPTVGATVANAGFSGMAQTGPNTYLVVHDTKGHRDGPRLGLVEITGQGLAYTPVAVEDWRHPDGRASDLESACALPGRPGRPGRLGQPDEFLIAESGPWDGQYGRLFHLRLDGPRGEILRAYSLPILQGRGPDAEGDNYEGLACAPLEGNRVLLLLGERGGSSVYPTGILRVGVLDLATGDLQWREEGRAGIPITAPGEWPLGPDGSVVTPRAISDLYIDPDGTLWAVATADAGDLGPFRSIIYRLGTVTSGPDPGVALKKAPAATWVLDGLKVEALAGPAAILPGSALSLGTEDEDLGGVWRGLFPMP